MVSTHNNVPDNFVRCAVYDWEVMIHEYTGFFYTSNLIDFNTETRRQEIIFFAEGFAQMYGREIQLTFSNMPFPHANGTYYHPIVFLYASTQCSEEIYMKSIALIIKYFNSSQDHQLQFSRLLQLDELNFVTLQHSAQFGLYQIEHAGLDLVINKNKWINVTRFCKNNNNEITDFKIYPSFKHFSDYMFERLGKSPIVKLNGSQTVWEGTYYHPLLFLKMISIISDEFYIAVFNLVFGYSRNISTNDQVQTFPLEKFPFRTEVMEESTDTLNSTSKPNKLIHENILELTCIEDLKNKLDTTDRLLNDNLLLLSNKDNELNHVNTKYVTIWNKYQDALKLIEELKISTNRVNDLQKSNLTVLPTYQNQTTSVDDHIVCDVQTLLVVRLNSGIICGFRKPLGNLMCSITHNTHVINSFDYWYFVNHSTSDFSRLQDYLRLKHGKRNCVIHGTDVEFIIKNPRGNIEDVNISIFNFFIDFPEFIKLNVNVFKNKFEKKHLEISASISPVVNKMYNFVNDYL